MSKLTEAEKKALMAEGKRTTYKPKTPKTFNVFSEELGEWVPVKNTEANRKLHNFKA